MSKCSPYKPLKKKTIMLKTKLKEALGDVNELELILYEDGNIAFSHDNAEQFTYLYKDQIAKLVKILAKKRLKV